MTRYGQTTLSGYRSALSTRGYALFGESVPKTITGTKKNDPEKVAKLVDKIGKALKKVGSLIGGVTQARFIDRYFEIKNALNAAGYTYPDHDKLITDLKIRKSQVKNRKDSYADEFKRLFEYAVIRINQGNPDMGLYWGEVYPFKMNGHGQIKSLAVNKLKEIVKRFPPGTWKGEQIFYADTIPADVEAQPNDPLQQLQQKVVNGYTIVHNAAGVVKEIRDAAGNLLNPGSPQYNQTLEDLNPKQAGFSPWVVGLSCLAFAGVVVAMTSGNDKKEEKK